MKTIVFNVMERQEMYNSRAPLSEILKGIEKQLFKKVQFERKKVKHIITDAILSKRIADQLGEESELTIDQTELLQCVNTHLDSIDENTTLDSFSTLISDVIGRPVTGKEIQEISISGQGLTDILENIKNVAIEKRKNYQEVEKGIVQVTAIDLVTNSIDRHLNNWALMRDKRTDRYTIGLFDHATAFTNLSLRNNPVPYMRGPFSTQWEQSSVLLDRDRDKKVEGSRGDEVFKYIMNNYRDYVIEILQILHDKLPEFERAIDYEIVPISEYNELSENEKKQFFASEMDTPILPRKIIEGIKKKFREIEKNYDICLGPDGREDY